MLKRLHENALRADLEQIDRILASRAKETDPAGWYQFTKRREAVARELQESSSSPRSKAAIGLFFGGRPVLGSHGILADFGGKVVEQFQTLLSTCVAAEGFPIGSRGPLPQRDRSKMLLTDVARGSFGFILEQDGDEELFETSLKSSLQSTVDLLHRVSAPDDESFELATEAVDNRVLGVLRGFFKLLADSGAIIRIVEESREFALNRDDVERARERTETLEVNDIEERQEGVLYLLPTSMKFDLTLTDGQTISGNVSKNALTPLLNFGGGVKPGILGETKLVMLRRRDVLSSNKLLRSNYTLLGIEY